MTNEEIMILSLEELEARKAEIKAIVEDTTSEADFDALSAEVDLLEERKAVLVEEQRKLDIQNVIDEVDTKEIDIEIPVEERKMKTLKEIRDSQEYIEAYADYLKSGDDKECRALLTELADGDYGANVVPVPSFVEEEIKTAWDNDKILSRVTKTFIKGVLRVGFELSATGASIHAEGEGSPNEEELALGVVTITPATIKKWITISDEAIDLTGEAFVRYIYDELTYRITKLAADTGIDAIKTAPSTSNSTAVGITTIDAEPSLTTVAAAISELSDNATNPVVIMNKKTYKLFKELQYNGNYAIDPFEGLEVIFNNTLTAYENIDPELGEQSIYMIVGDLKGLHYNYPNGEGVTIKWDDLTLAEQDLVKVVGRQFVGIAVDVPGSFVRIQNPTES